jgi:hypothetical protein
MQEKKYVYYEDFGAIGDGIHDDWEAIRDAHNFANERRKEGYSVKGTPGKTYLIRDITSPTVIMTDVDWEDVSFTVDDRGLAKGAPRDCRIFHIAPEVKRYPLSKEEIDEIFPGRKIDKNDFKRVEWKYGFPALLFIYNENVKNYRRMGANGLPSGGGSQLELISVDKDGRVSEDTPLLFSYDAITAVHVVRTDDTPITIKGGRFTSIANDIPQYENFYISRGFGIKRSNTTITGLEHYIEGELDGLTPDTRGTSYAGFIFFEDCQDVMLENAVLTAPKYYKFAGTYDLRSCLVNRFTVKNTRQSNFFRKEDGKPSMLGNMYWGINGSSYCKNTTYDSCVLSRFDAHSGIYNGKVINSTLNAIEIIGGGELYVENTTLILSRPLLVDLRTDYGSTFNGTVTFKNCKVKNFNPEKISVLRGTWVNGYYGYECHIPNVIIDNLEFDEVGSIDIMDVQVPRSQPEKRYDTLSKDTFLDGTKNENPYIPFDFVKIINNRKGYDYRLYDAPYFKEVRLEGVRIYNDKEI